MYTDGVFRVENGIFILKESMLDRARSASRRWTDLTSGVDDVTIVLYALVDDSFGEGALDGGVVRLYEVVFYELYDEGGLSCMRKEGLSGRYGMLGHTHQPSENRERRSFSSSWRRPL